MGYSGAMNPRLWASPVPFGVSHVKPRHFREMLRIAWENRDALGHAWRILTRGVCDGCALGTSGLKDWTLEGTHLCMVRLELMRLNTMPAMDPAILADLAPLAGKSSEELRAMGRLPEPMLRRKGEKGFRVLSWDEALDLAASQLMAADPERACFYLTSRGITNEAYYAAQKAARLLGSPHIDNSARLCHAASTSAMQATLGHGASTCSYTDWLGADLIVLFGSNLPNNQPVAAKYLHVAKGRGALVAAVNPYREPGLRRYWIPSVPESALFGTRLVDRWFEVDTGGDLAFLHGALKALIEADALDHDFIRGRTTGFEEVRRLVSGLAWERLERSSGAPRVSMQAFARLLAERPNAVLVWSMGLTQHAHGADTVKALVNLGLARGLPGRPNRGFVPIRGHSGVQGGAEVGCTPSVPAETLTRWEALWGFPVPRAKGLTAARMVDEAAEGRVDVFWIVGGNFLETLPGEERAREALRRPRLRLHQDIALNTSMLVEPAHQDGAVLLLPATTRYESPGGGTETSTERRIIFSPEIPGRRIGSARPEWQVFGDLMARLRPELAERLRFADAAAVRREIEMAVPLYQGIALLAKQGDQVQWGGGTLYADGRFGTPDGKARFSAVPLPERRRPEGSFLVSTRRGKQFNAMVQRDADPLNGAFRRDVLVCADDMKRLGLYEGDPVRLVSDAGSFDGAAKLADIKPGNLEVHWPEGMALIAAGVLDPESGEPDYNAVVTLERAP